MPSDIACTYLKLAGIHFRLLDERVPVLRLQVRPDAILLQHYHVCMVIPVQIRPPLHVRDVSKVPLAQKVAINDLSAAHGLILWALESK